MLVLLICEIAPVVYWYILNVAAKNYSTTMINYAEIKYLYIKSFFSDLCEKENVNGYPSIKYYKFGSYAMNYKNSRTSRDFATFFDQLPSSSSTVDKKEEL